MAVGDPCLFWCCYSIYLINTGLLFFMTTFVFGNKIVTELTKVYESYVIAV